MIDGLGGSAEVTTGGVLVGKRDAGHTGCGGGRDSADVVFDRDGLEGVRVRAVANANS